jgi:DNA-binding transcriptional MerR regulator/uncharacterized protein (DUF433 family)
VVVRKRSFKYVGRGLYSVREAARLTGVPSARIRRWTSQSTYKRKSGEYVSPPVVATRLEPIDGSRVVDFGDLLEIRFLDSFRKHGVSMQAIRVAADHAREFLGRHHPFSSRIFKTDGRTILADIITEFGDRHMLDLVKNQYAFEKVISPYLYEGVEYDAKDDPTRWKPLVDSDHVVIDPKRSFGAPIVTEGVPTIVLSQAVLQEGDAELVAAIYRVDVDSVKDAVRFERSLAS